MGTARFVGPTAASVGLVLATLLPAAARGEEARISIGGYDPVAYFTDGKPVQGKPDIEIFVAPIALALRQRQSPRHVRQGSGSLHAAI